MPLLLKKTTKFMNEMFKFKENMSLISNEEIKKAINDKIDKIYKLADEIDEAHNTHNPGIIAPNLLSDKRTELNKLRHQVTQMIKIELNSVKRLNVNGSNHSGM